MESYEDIRRMDLQRQTERRVILRSLINREFPDARISIAPDDPWRVRVELDIPQTTAIVFQPDDPVMMDVGNNFERIFDAAISLARQILAEPRVQGIYQGKILLSNRGVSFDPYRG